MRSAVPVRSIRMHDPRLPALSVVMSTYNREEVVEGAIRSVISQNASSPPFELIVVDNNSSDSTRDIIERLADTDSRVRYVFEPKQGLSHARNAGLRVAAAPLVAFTDDDVRVKPDWVASVVGAFEKAPDADFVGGRVLPLWPSHPPAWLTRDHWAPLALVDYGDECLEITGRNALCLVGANVAFRKSVFDLVGTFATDFQRVKNGIGSIEDHEFQLRLLRIGRKGLYDPRITILADVQPDRFERDYHRRWHRGHGHFHALLRSEQIERTRLGTLFGVPAHMYRRALVDALHWVRDIATGRRMVAFTHELALQFFYGFFRTKQRLRREPGSVRFSAELQRIVRQTDAKWHRLRAPEVRDVVFDARTAMEYAMMGPVLQRLLADGRVRTWLLSSERPDHVGEIFRDAPREVRRISPGAAMLKRFDAYVAADFVWATLPRGTCRVQMFHGVAGKWSEVYDRPRQSMRHWERLFFINGRRLSNYAAAGAIDPDSSAIRLIGMPKSDCLVDGTYTRNAVLAAEGMDPGLPTVMYAPTWTPFSSLNVMGEEVVARLIDAGYRVLVKLHENSLDPRAANSGGVDWVSRLTPILNRGHGHLLKASDASPWLIASDVLVTDHSSIGFEYLLLDRPLIRIAVPELIRKANIGREYVNLMASASTTVDSPSAVVAAVERALAVPSERSLERRAVAEELFYQPGTATERAVTELYALMELEVPGHDRMATSPGTAPSVLSGAAT